MRIVCRFVAQKITVCTGLKVFFIALFRLFTDGKRDGTIGICFANSRHDLADTFIREIRVLTALQNEGAETERISLFAAGKDMLFLQAITLRAAVISADTAVVAVIFAVVRKLYKSADVYRIAVIFSAHTVGSFKECCIVFIGF